MTEVASSVSHKYAKVGKVETSKGPQGLSWIETDSEKLVCSIFGPRRTDGFIANSSSTVVCSHDRSVTSATANLTCNIKLPCTVVADQLISRLFPNTSSLSSTPANIAALQVAISNFVISCIRSSIHLDVYPMADIDIFIEVLQYKSLPSLMTSAIHATTLALAEAQIFCSDTVSASAAIVDFNGHVLMDPSAVDSNDIAAFATVAVMAGRGELTAVYVTSLSPTIHVDLDAIVKAAYDEAIQSRLNINKVIYGDIKLKNTQVED